MRFSQIAGLPSKYTSSPTLAVGTSVSTVITGSAPTTGTGTGAKGITKVAPFLTVRLNALVAMSNEAISRNLSCVSNAVLIAVLMAIVISAHEGTWAPA